jgi:hypothetical protein
MMKPTNYWNGVRVSRWNKRRRNIIIRKPMMHEMPTVIIIWFCTCVLTGASFGLGYFLLTCCP